MKTLILFAIVLAGCEMPVVAPCNYTLTDYGDEIHIKINSDSEVTDLYYYYGDEKIRHRVTKHFYDCISISRTETPMWFEIDGCRQKI